MEKMPEKARVRLSQKMMLRFNKNFYTLAIITQALEDFKNICGGSAKEGASFIEVELNPKGQLGGIADIKGEFCNYLIGLIKNG